jgi:DNA-binding MarR family transcriptional regulator
MISERHSTKGESVRRVQIALRQLTQGLHRVNEAVGSRIELLAGDLEVLDLLSRDGPMSPRDISMATSIHPATLTGVLDRLEGGGWLMRRPDASDRRKLLVEPALDRGGEMARLYAPMGKALASICADYTPAELALIAGFLEKTADAGAHAAAEIRSTSPDRRRTGG